MPRKRGHERCARGGGLEPPQCYPLAPETSASRRGFAKTVYNPVSDSKILEGLRSDEDGNTRKAREMMKRTERGWAGHFICAERCRFRRNTLLEIGDMAIVVSTVGAMMSRGEDKPETIGHERYYETKVRARIAEMDAKIKEGK